MSRNHLALRSTNGEVDRLNRICTHAGLSADASQAAITVLGLQMHREPTSITDKQIDGVRTHRCSDREIANVVGIVALNILTGAFNLLAGVTPGSAA